ncbi:ankyrin repeat protein [Colletotrichum camelliae]|nr:ankyrin repeat protein [Colletotrichum camelliae]
MSGPLSIAASIAGIVSLSAEVFQRVSKFVKEAKDAQKSLRELADQIRNLSGILQNLYLLASSLENENTPTILKAYHIHNYSQILFEIEDVTKKALQDFNKGKTSAVFRSLKWPFSIDATRSLAARLASSCDTLKLALSVDTMRKLLECLASQDELKSGLGLLSQKLDRVSTIQARIELNKKRKETIGFFLQVNPQNIFQASLRLRQPLTGLWLTESDPTFQKWRSIPHSAIWLSGMPGAGKTVLCAVAIDEMLQLTRGDDSTAVAFFFCDYKSQESRELVNLLSSVAVQLAQQKDAAFAHVESYFASLNPQDGLQRQPEVDELQEVLSDVCSEYERVFVIIDGLDECGTAVEEIAAGVRVFADNCLSVSIAVLSRNEPEIEEELADPFDHVEISARKEDIDLYVRAEMTTRKKLKRLAFENPELAALIKDKLINGAGGMFRWVTCQLDYIEDLGTNRDRREALESLPPTLQGTYQRLLQRVLKAGPTASRLVKKVLHWTAVSRLSVHEIREAVSIPDSHLDEFGPDDLYEIEHIFRSCSSLIRRFHTIENSDSTGDFVEFSHFTVAEYLKGIDPASDVAIFKLDYKAAEIELSTLSLRMILMKGEAFDYSTLGSTMLLKHLTHIFNSHPFYFFATVRLSEVSERGVTSTVSWDHIENSEMFESLRSIFGPQKSASFLSVALGGAFSIHGIRPTSFDDAFWDSYDEKNRRFATKAFDILNVLLSPDFTPLKYAAAIGLPKLCMSLTSAERALTQPTLEASLCCAIDGQKIFFPTRKLNFLSHGYCVVDYSTPRMRTIDQLLKSIVPRKSYPNGSSEWPQANGWTPVNYAVSNKAESVLNELLRAELDFVIGCRDPVEQAVLNGYHHIARQLLRSRSSPDTDNPDKQPSEPTTDTAKSNQESSWEWELAPSPHLLGKVIQHYDERLCKSIISRGISVDVDLPGCSECPVRPIVRAIQLYRSDCVKLLVSMGASLEDSQCRKFPLGLQNIVSLVIWRGLKQDVLECVLDACLARKVWWMDGRQIPFHVAAATNRLEALVQLKLHLEDNFESYRSCFGHKPQFEGRSFQSFLSAVISAPGSFDSASGGMSNLAAASQTEEEKSQEKSRRSEDRTHNSYVEESLGISLSGFTMSSDKTQDQEFADVLESVMENNFQDNSEQTSAPTRLATPLHWAVAMRSEKVIDELIKFGADIDALDNFQRTPLICAADINSARIVKKLVCAGADTSCYDEEDYTALVIAVQHGNLEMIRYLEGDNMSIDTSSRMGATVLNAVNDSGIAAPKMFSYFLSKGVDPHRRGMKTMGPVTGAFKGQPGYVALGVYILNTGLLASVDESDNGNPLAQVVATCGQDVKLLKMIFRFLNSHNMCGRFLEYRSIEDSTALCNAAIAESIPCLDILLQMGADINREGCVQGISDIGFFWEGSKISIS